jgi:hypothetical protein
MNVKSIAILIALFCPASIAWPAEAASAADEEFGRQISQLVQQLNDDRAAERDAAEQELLELAGTTAVATDRFLLLLPEDSDQMPLAVRERLGRIRQQVEDRVAKSSVEVTKVTLAANEMPLAQVFAAIKEQTGNRLVDNREEQQGQPGAGQKNITIELKDEPFWSAVDQILDKATLGIYSYGGEEALSIVGRASDEAPRHGRASYGGPFRIDILELQGQKNLRQPNLTSLKVQLEIAWEPRLRPISLSQPASDVSATTDTGQQLSVSQQEAELDVEVPGGSQATEMILPFQLPDREAKQITSLKGKLRALVPGRQVKFRFDDLANAAGKSERRGGVQVTLDDVRKNNAIWEVHMRVALDEGNDALESHRDWVFQNVSFLVGKDNEPIDNAGFETTRQTRNEVGIAYLFDLPDGIEGLSWVYETPAAIVELPVEYEIKNIELP